MQLGGQRASGNVEDRRGMGMVGGGLGIGGIVIALVAFAEHRITRNDGSEHARQVDVHQNDTKSRGTGAPTERTEKIDDRLADYAAGRLRDRRETPSARLGS